MPGILSEQQSRILGTLLAHNPNITGILGAVQDPMFYADMVKNIPGVLGTTLPSQQEGMAALAKDPRYLSKSPELQVMASMTPPEKLGALSQSYDDKLKQLGILGIVTPSQAGALKTAKQLPDTEIFRSAVSNTPGAKITQDGLLLRIQRSQHPDQAGRASIRGGVFYLPEGAAQAKHYSTGKSGYGGTEKVSGETLISNPMFVKGATGGKAPEAAFDAIRGKGAYEAMRSEALKATGIGRPNVAHIEDFLNKYAPELLDYVDDIVRHTSKGNQLPYALQEAAVSSAVRKSGYDAVLGYSVARKNKQPFISEIFDVRESTYPDKFGTPTDIWDSFK